MSQLRPSGHPHGRHDHAGHHIAANLLVPGFLSDRPSQKRNLFSRAQPPSGRLIRHSLAAAHQDPEGYDRSRGGPRAAGKNPDRCHLPREERQGSKLGRG